MTRLDQRCFLSADRLLPAPNGPVVGARPRELSSAPGSGSRDVAGSSPVARYWRAAARTVRAPIRQLPEKVKRWPRTD
jgi:hypothetical protein